MSKHIAMLLGGENRGAQIELDYPLSSIRMDKIREDRFITDRNANEVDITIEVETYVYIATTDRGIRLYLIEDQLD